MDRVSERRSDSGLACGSGINEVGHGVLVLSDGDAVAEAVVGWAGEEFGGHAHGHFEGVGAVVVLGDGEFLELVEEEFC